MANLSRIVDAMLKEYFLFRGFTTTLKAFENEIKIDKDKSFRVEKIVEQIQLMIINYDLMGLKNYWSHLDRRFFSKLSHEAYRNVNKLETSLLRLYLVHAIQNSKQEKVTEFFEKSAVELQNISSWKDWFAIPFLKNPEQNPLFSIYFTRVWQESVMVALYNCINTVFSTISLPSILNFEEDRKKLERLIEENRELKEEVVALQEELLSLKNEKRLGRKSVHVQTNNVSIGEECDYLVVNTKTLQTKPNTTPAVKKSRWKLKAAKESKSAKKQQEESLLKRKKRLSYDKQEGEQELSNMKVENVKTASPSRIITNDLNDTDTISVISSENTDEHKTPSQTSAVSGNSLSSNEQLLTGSLDHFTDDLRKPFILLSQDNYSQHCAPVANCRFSADGRLVGSIDTEGVIKLWQFHPTPLTISTITSKPQALSFDWVSKHERKLLYGNSNSKISLYDVVSKKSIFESFIDSKYQRIVAISSSPVGTSFVCSTASGIRKRSDTFSFSSNKYHTQLTKLQSLTESNEPSIEGTIFRWDLKTFKEQAELALDPYPVCIHCMSFNHNGTLLATGGADGMIRLFDMRTCDCLVGWHGHSSEVLDVQFSADETSLFSLGADRKLCTWDVHKVSFKLAEFSLHNGCTGLHSQLDDVNGSMTDYMPVGRLLAFDADGKYMLTCASNGSLMYYVDSKQALEQIMMIPGQKSSVSSLDWNSSPNCSICVTGQANGTIQVSSLLRR